VEFYKLVNIKVSWKNANLQCKYQSILEECQFAVRSMFQSSSVLYKALDPLNWKYFPFTGWIPKYSKDMALWD